MANPATDEHAHLHKHMRRLAEHSARFLAGQKAVHELIDAQLADAARPPGALPQPPNLGVHS